MSVIKKIAKSVLPHAVVRSYERRYELKPSNAPLDEKKIAIISPYEVKYTDLLHDAIRTAGYEPSTKASNAKYIWLHWYENGIGDYTKFVDKIAAIKAWKQQGRKIIFHIHNKQPHETKVPNISHALMTVLADSADQVSIMSTRTKDLLKSTWYYGDDFSKASYVPHPNYVNAYGEMIEPTLLGDDKLKILFFGLVRPYKGIEHLLEATRGLKNIHVSIIGNPSNAEYAEKIRKSCADRDDVTIRFEYIADEEIPKIFAEHHVVALPYNIESSLNSGAAILALSYARTVVGTNNGTLSDIHKDDLYFGYDYSNELDHTKQLRKTIQSIQATYAGKYNQLLEIGDRAFRLIKKDNGNAAIAKAIESMIRRVR
jgi:beta-1,4-mannosyltransferase